MANHGWPSEFTDTEYSDWDGLASTYGDWGYDSQSRRESVDGSAWITFPSGPPAARPMIASTWGQGSTLMPVAIHDTNGDPHLYRWQRSDNTAIDWNAPYTFGRQLGQIGAGSTYGKRFVTFESGQQMTDARKYLRFSYQSNATNATVIYSSQPLGRHGHTGAFDERSDRLIHVWMTNENQIVLSHSSGTSDVVTPVELSGVAYQAVYTPAIVCGDPSIYYNCILTWASTGEGGEHYHRLHWLQFRVNGSGASASFAFATAYSNSYLQYAPPSVGYNATTGGFLVAFKNPGPCVYTMTKGSLSTSPFGAIKGSCGGATKHYGPPMVGTSTNTWNEVWRWSNDD